MGFFDDLAANLNTSDVLRSILGASGEGMPPAPMQNGQGGASPGGAPPNYLSGVGPSIGDGMTGSNGAGPSFTSSPTTPDAPVAPMIASGADVPMPSPRPQAADTGLNVPLPTSRPDTSLDALAMGGGAQPGMPMSLAPPQPTPVAQRSPVTSQDIYSSRPATPQSGGIGAMLAAAFGLPIGGAGAGANTTPSQIPQLALNGMSQGMQPTNPMRSVMAGLGKGMSAVGALPRGAPAGQAFAAGMGGSLQGQTGDQEKQQQQLFTNSTTAFKDFVAAKASGDASDLNQARAKYYNAQYESMLNGQGRFGGSNAWQNTPQGRTTTIEKMSNDYQTRQQQLLQKQWQLNGAQPDQQQQDLQGLQKRVDEFRQRLYKSPLGKGLDPNTSPNMGVDSKNPVDTTGMDLNHFNQTVPLGAWYKDQNGVVRQRTVPPAGSGQQQSQSGMSPGTAYDVAQPPA